MTGYPVGLCVVPAMCQARLLLLETPGSDAVVTTGSFLLPAQQRTFVGLGSERLRGFYESVQPTSPGSDCK